MKLFKIIIIEVQKSIFNLSQDINRYKKLMVFGLQCEIRGK
jgi:hypothetical protein